MALHFQKRRNMNEEGTKCSGIKIKEETKEGIQRVC
jgi:hypothetical protein